MRYSHSTAALIAALSISSVVAGPARRHVHHQHQHQKKEAINYDVPTDPEFWSTAVDWKSLFNNGASAASAAAAAATPVSAAEFAPTAVSATPTPEAAAANPVQAAASAVASAVDEAASTILEIFGGVKGFANDLTAFGAGSATSGSAGDFYRGNCGSPYGSNMIKVSDRGSYQYTIEFINTSAKSISIYLWNKIGSDGQVLSGSALAPQNTALTFALAAGAKQMVAFQEDSQVGFAQACSQKTASGAFATTWGEVNFVKTGSGYDVSAIMNPNNNNYDMSISSVEAPQCTSDRTQNFWLTETQPIGDSNGSCYIAQNHATITVKMGGTI